MADVLHSETLVIAEYGTASNCLNLRMSLFDLHEQLVKVLDLIRGPFLDSGSLLVVQLLID